MNAEDFHVRPGQPVRAAVRRLARLVLRQKQITTGAGIRRHQTADGTAVVADLRGSPFAGAFTIRLQEKKATIGHGTCNGLVPTIEELPIDGVIDGVPGKVPVLDLSDGPNDDDRSWITLAAVADAENEGEFLFEIAHVIDPALLDGRPDEEDRGHHPLGMLVWTSAGLPQRVVRNVYFNQQHRFSKTSNRHLFQAAS